MRASSPAAMAQKSQIGDRSNVTHASPRVMKYQCSEVQGRCWVQAEGEGTLMPAALRQWDAQRTQRSEAQGWKHVSDQHAP